jgi:formylglycine-generating enzyme required for sulfatase activity
VPRAEQSGLFTGNDKNPARLDGLIRRHSACPVEFADDDVSWDEAAAWPKYAGKRLPTEVEFEFAATAGVRQAYHEHGKIFQEISCRN